MEVQELMEQEIDGLRERLEEKQKAYFSSIRQMHKDLLEKDKVLTQRNEMLKSTRARNEELEEKVRQLNQANRELKKLERDVRCKMSQLSSEQESERREWEKAKRILQDELESERNQSSCLRETIGTLQSQLTEASEHRAQEERAEVASRVEKDRELELAKAEIQSLKRDLEVSGRVNATMRNQLNMRNDPLYSLSPTAVAVNRVFKEHLNLSDFYSELQIKKARCEQLVLENKKQQEQLEKYQEELHSSFLPKISRLQEEAASVCRVNVDLEEKMAALKSEVERLRRSVALGAQEVQNERNSKLALQRSMSQSTLEESVPDSTVLNASRQQEDAELRLDLAKAREELNELSRDRESCQRLLTTLQTENAALRNVIACEIGQEVPQDVASSSCVTRSSLFIASLQIPRTSSSPEFRRISPLLSSPPCANRAREREQAWHVEEKRALQDRIDQLRKELNESSERSSKQLQEKERLLTSLQYKKGVLESECDDLKEKSAELENERRRAVEECLQLRQDNSMLRDQHKMLEEKVAELEAALHDMTLANEELESKLNSERIKQRGEERRLIRDSLKMAEQEKEKMSKEFLHKLDEALAAMGAEGEAEKKKLQEEVIELRLENSCLRSGHLEEVTTLRGSFRELESQVSELKEKLREETNQGKKLKEHLTEANRHIKELTDAQGPGSLLEARCRRTEKDLEDAQANLEVAKEKIRAAETELELLRPLKKELEEKEKEIKKEHEDYVSALEEKKEDVRKLEEAMAALIQTSEKAAAETRDWQEKYSVAQRLEKVVEEKESALTDLESRLEEEVRSSAELRLRLNVLEEAAASTRKADEEHQRELVEARLKEEEMKKKTADLETALSAAAEDQKKSTEQLEVLQARVDLLKKEAMEAESLRAQLAKAEDESFGSVTSLVEENRKLHHVVAESKKKIRVAYDEWEKEKERIQQMEAQIQDLIQQNQQLENRVEEMKRTGSHPGSPAPTRPAAPPAATSSKPSTTSLVPPLLKDTYSLSPTLLLPKAVASAVAATGVSAPSSPPRLTASVRPTPLVAVPPVVQSPTAAPALPSAPEDSGPTVPAAEMPSSASTAVQPADTEDSSPTSSRPLRLKRRRSGEGSEAAGEAKRSRDVDGVGSSHASQDAEVTGAEEQPMPEGEDFSRDDFDEYQSLEEPQIAAEAAAENVESGSADHAGNEDNEASGAGPSAGSESIGGRTEQEASPQEPVAVEVAPVDASVGQQPDVVGSHEVQGHQISSTSTSGNRVPRPLHPVRMAPVAIETPVAASASSSSPDDAPAASAGTPGNPRPEPEASLSSEDPVSAVPVSTRASSSSISSVIGQPIPRRSPGSRGSSRASPTRSAGRGGRGSGVPQQRSGVPQQRSSPQQRQGDWGRQTPVSLRRPVASWAAGGNPQGQRGPPVWEHQARVALQHQMGSHFGRGGVRNPSMGRGLPSRFPRRRSRM